jgi:hypothetical protein
VINFRIEIRGAELPRYNRVRFISGGLKILMPLSRLHETENAERRTAESIGNVKKRAHGWTSVARRKGKADVAARAPWWTDG